MISVVAFLGNYGREYENTRHNTAWQFASQLPFMTSFLGKKSFMAKLPVWKQRRLQSGFVKQGF